MAALRVERTLHNHMTFECFPVLLRLRASAACCNRSSRTRSQETSGLRFGNSRLGVLTSSTILRFSAQRHPQHPVQRRSLTRRVVRTMGWAPGVHGRMGLLEIKGPVYWDSCQRDSDRVLILWWILPEELHYERVHGPSRFSP